MNYLHCHAPSLCSNATIPRQVCHKNNFNNWDYRRALQGKKGWNQDVKKLLQSAEQVDVFYGLGVERQNHVLSQYRTHKELEDEKSLLKEINSMQKLRTYKELKLSSGTENYLTTNMEKYNRSLITKIRIGTLPINIETGRYKNQPVEERKCPKCTNAVEDEKHFLMDCPLYKELRQELYRKVQDKTGIDATELNRGELFYLLLNVTKAIRPTANFIKEALRTRSNYKIT